MEPKTISEIGIVAIAGEGAIISPARPPITKIIGIWLPRMACARTRTATLRFARRSFSVSGAVCGMSERLVSVMPRALQEGVAVVQTMRCRRSAAHCAAMRICGKMKGIWRGCDHRNGGGPGRGRAGAGGDRAALRPRDRGRAPAAAPPARRVRGASVGHRRAAGLDRECRRHLGPGGSRRSAPGGGDPGRGGGGAQSPAD